MDINYKEWVGQKISKIDNSVFRSGLKRNTIRYIITHPITGKPAFQFDEDNSCVEAHKCILVENKN